MKIKTDNFNNLQGWMRTELNLKGNELIIYSNIYGFTQDGGWCKASAQYHADWCGISKRAALMILKRLTDSGKLEKREVEKDGVKFCYYRYIRPGEKTSPPVKKNHQGDEKTSPGRGKNFTTPGEKTSPNNKEGNLNDTKEQMSQPAKPAATRVPEEALKLAKKLHERIIANKPNRRIDKNWLENWAADIDKLHRIDGRSWDDIEKAINWSQDSDFWRSNILSGKKLRDKIDYLEDQMARGQGQACQHYNLDEI